MGQRKSYFLQGRTFYVFQKGRPRDPYFIDEACFGYYLNRFLHCIRASRLQLHTYVLLPYETQLLISPYSGNGLLRILGKVASDYGEYFRNRFNGSCPLLQDNPVLHQVGMSGQVLNCQKSIEMAPVREQLVDMPGEYPWSGYHINAFGGHKDPMVMHHQYRKFCSESESPFQRYRDFVAATSSARSFHPGPEGCLGYSESASMM